MYIGTGDETILAVNSLLMQFFMFFSFLIDGFANASEALIGRFIGSRRRESLKKAIKITICLGSWVSGIVFTLIYLFASKPILGLLTDIPECKE